MSGTEPCSILSRDSRTGPATGMPSGYRRRHFGIVTQVYPPDPAAVGQHLADVADELARRGHRVTVITADRGYDDPSQRYRHFEWHGIAKAPCILWIRS